MALLRRFTFVLIAVLLVTVTIAAQQAGLSGTIDDGTGVLPDATVALRSNSGTNLQTTTDNRGQYRFAAVPAGEYDLTVFHEGFGPATRTVRITGAAQTINVTLTVGGLSTAVDVTGEAPAGLTERLATPTSAGSRLNLSSLDTPASVTAISREDILFRGDSSVNAAVTRAVGITSTASVGAANTTVAARGFGDTSVAYLYDGIRNMADIGDVAWPYDPWTVERIEVLNGPASVLYGIGGIGGSINVVPRRPSRVRDNSVRLSGGTYRTYGAALDSTGPIGQRAAYRFDFSQKASSGFLDKGTSESTAVSGSLSFQLTDKLRASVMNDFAYIQPMDYNGLPMVNGTPQKSLLEQNYGSSDMDVHFYENSSRVELGWTQSPTLSVRNITSLLYADRMWRMGPTGYSYRPATNDILRSDYGIWAQHQVQWSNQLDVTSRRRWAGRPNTLVVGFSAERFDYTRRVTLWPGMTDVVPLLDTPKFGSYPATGAVNSNAANNLVNRGSVFAEDRIEVAPKLSLVGGVRVDFQHFDRINLLVDDKASRSDTPVSPRVGAVYTVHQNTNVYAQYSQATDAPDYLFCCGSANAVRTLEPTRGRQVEAGIKQASNRAEWTVAGYRIRKTNLLIYDQTSGIAERYIQAGAQSSTGVEATASLNLGAGVRIGANGTVLRPRFDDLLEFSNGEAVSRNGNTPPNVPWKSGNLLLSWAFAPRWTAQGAFRFVGKRYIDTANTESLALPGYNVLDTTVAWNASDKVMLAFRSANLFDEFYPVTVTGDGQGGANWIAGAPRTFELEMRVGF